eukprot:9326272-Alexandrium_andersonii.AAC.1
MQVLPDALVEVGIDFHSDLAPPARLLVVHLLVDVHRPHAHQGRPPAVVHAVGVDSAYKAGPQ